MPVELTIGEEGPERVGRGAGLTVTPNVVGVIAAHPFVFVQETLTVFEPDEVHVTVTELLEVVPPAVMVPPVEIVQV